MALSKAAQRIIDSTTVTPIKAPEATALGSPGYDNVREDIEKTKSIREGSVEKVPTEENDIVNKEYVDSVATRSSVDLFLTENASDIGTYFDLVIDVDTSAKQNIVQSISSNSTTLIASFASRLNEGEINAIDLLESGVYDLHIHAEGQVVSGLFIYFEFYKRAAGGTETLLGTSHDSSKMTGSETEYDIHATISSDTAWISGDRIIVKVYGRNNNNQNRTITIYMEGDTASRIDFPGFVSPTFVADHDIDFHDTTATGAELNTLTGGGDTTLHDHDGISENTSARHTAGADTALGSGAVAADHGTAATDLIVNVSYGTGAPPTANTTTIGSLFIKYTA